uniref:G-protein coupled receptors family 1 profile domain-containing protein n=1 Tax=Globodera rostochiensis TaxID=31243 RepID=A0A914HX24_GLORO
MEQQNSAGPSEDIDNTFFLNYKDLCPWWPIIASAIVMVSISVLGIFLNSFLIFVTARTKSLHGTANVFLALTSAFEVLHEFGHFFFLATALSGNCFVPYRNAFRFLALSLFGLCASTLSMLFTGFDRFYCVLFPMKYNHINFWLYIVTGLLLCTVPSVYLLFLYWQISEQMPSMQVTGSIGDLIWKGGYAYSVYRNAKLGCTSATMLVYIVVACVIRAQQKSNSSAVSSQHRRIFFSLLVIVLFNVGGYYLISMFYVFMPSLNGQVVLWDVRMALSIPANLCGASNAPILFMTSNEYRKAFKKQCQNISSLLFSSASRSSAIQPANFVLQTTKNQSPQPPLNVPKRRATILPANSMEWKFVPANSLGRKTILKRPSVPLERVEEEIAN